jgi:hypothetical protein
MIPIAKYRNDEEEGERENLLDICLSSWFRVNAIVAESTQKKGEVHGHPA